MANRKVHYHDIDADPLDYQVNWYKWLESSDSISSSQWIVSSHVTVACHTNTTSSAIAWVTVNSAARISGARYTITNRINTTNGRKNIDQSFDILLNEN